MDPRESIEQTSRQVQTGFREANRILDFETWLELFLSAPYRLGRSAPQYVADMFDHFGRETVDSAEGPVERFRLFDQDFRGGRGRVHGQEAVQREIYRLVRAAADEGRADKLVLLHGPNGSGKSVLVEAVFRGLEHYSQQPEGATYRFNWVFPKSGGPTEGSLGFGVRPVGEAEGSPGSFALAESETIAARLVCELKDHPLFLFPRADRERVLEAALENRPEDRNRSFRWLIEGDLCQKCKGIYEGLLAGYQGDWKRVIGHVQVERFFFSQRFRTGAVTILPMASVDAREQQITADLSVQNLPPVLQNLKIFEPFGDLVEANAGVVEFGDFLKRPMDLNKYLLNTVEKGTITLPNSLVALNLVMLGTSNEKQLDAFKTTPEWTSFKGRIELVPVPYILQYEREAELYRDMLAAVAREVHVAPHTFELAALFAVLTRLLRPDAEGFEGPMKDLADTITPMEKARLYQYHEAPERLERDDRQILLAALPDLRAQYRDSSIYEGRFGASPREMRMVLTAAAYDRKNECLTPALVFERLRELVRDKTVYDFLKLKPSQGYHHAENFIEQVTEVYGREVLDEIQDAMDLIREEEYDRRFDEYVLHVIAFNRKEKVLNPQTGERESPSEKVMRAIEDLLNVKNDGREDFRKDLVARIGAYAVDHPSEKIDFRSLFPDLLRAVKKQFFAVRREKVRSLVSHLIRKGTEDYDRLSAADREQVERTLENLADRHGYCGACARDAAAWLLHRGIA